MPEVVAIADSRIKFEINATDGDGGIQVFLYADPWKRMTIFDPRVRVMFNARARGRLAKQGGRNCLWKAVNRLSPSFRSQRSSSASPPAAIDSGGTDIEGERFEGSAMLTHHLPDGPVLVSPLEGTGPVDPDNAVMWEPVAPAGGSPIVGYQVLVVRPASPFSAIPKITLDVMMPATATSMQVPSGFLLPDIGYEWEVLAIEQAATRHCRPRLSQTAP